MIVGESLLSESTLCILYSDHAKCWPHSETPAGGRKDIAEPGVQVDHHERVGFLLI